MCHDFAFNFQCGDTCLAFRLARARSQLFLPLRSNEATLLPDPRLMGTFQKTLPQSKPGEKWLLLERVFKLETE